MTNPLTLKLEQFTRFDAAERNRLDALAAYPRKSFARGATIIGEGDRADTIHLVLDGLAARAKTLSDGSRQLMAFLVPGDLCDVEVFVLEAMDHDIVALADTNCVMIPAAVIEEMLTESAKLTKALWWSTMTDSAVLRARIVDHGSRDARERIAHLLCELLIRYRIVARASDDSFPFPLTQEDLADATGMTPVHVNRVLQQLRADGLIDYKSKVLNVLDPRGLKAAAQYEPNYLHLTRTEHRDPDVSGRVGDLVPAAHHRLLQDATQTLKSILGRS
ncbi:Crp/Fnr family transcriptional regulator [Sphingosinicella sp. BN140058]|uniref:Crp/Fnr family transcriptional regulator n=1 Tax=Sphingosinicella sp. BN140058 TaxID=1892855 RepID=UPI001010249B|nr:Crp/Fnr family transcriptional regulator [Sphingosinicella sp. BN140058]QAY79422.1 Crp/Fnr family transcriptional regulator [Sphingosinicella sp. BN140058]